MGYELIKGAQPASLRNMWAGWFPGKAHNDISGSLTDPAAPIGASDCDSVVWYEGALRQMFGYSVVTSSALDGVVTSLFYSPILSEFVGTAGAKLYKNMNDSGPTNITGAVTITAGNLMDWTEWQFESTKYIIGTDGTNPPIKWTGTGNASALAGSPPSGRWIATWQNAIWLGNTTSEPSTLFFSNIGDPETWTTDDDYKFDAPIRCIRPYGSMLVVFMDDHIGILSGGNNRQLTKIDRYINGVGTSGGHTVRAVKVGGRDLLMFHSQDGFYLFDGTKEVQKVSTPISHKYTANSNTVRWNSSKFSSAWSVVFPDFGWYITTLADGPDSTNQFMLITDTNANRLFSTTEGTSLPFWPCDSIPAACLEVAKITGVNTLYFGHSTDKKVYKFNPAVQQRNGSDYYGFWKSKVFDLQHSYIVQEMNILADETGSSAEVIGYVNMDLSLGNGNSGTADLISEADLLDVDLILDTSILGGAEFVNKNIQVTGYGRYLQTKLQNGTANTQLNLYGIDFMLQDIGMESRVEGV